MASATSPAFTPQSVRAKWDAFKAILESILEKGAQTFLFRVSAWLCLTMSNYYLCIHFPAHGGYVHFLFLSTFQAFFLGLCVWGLAGLLLQYSRLRGVRGYFIFIGLLIHVLAVVFFFGPGEPDAGIVLQILIMVLQPALAYALCSLCGTWPVWSTWLTSLVIAAVSYWTFSLASPVSEIAWVSLRANPTRYLMFLTYFALQYQYLHARFRARSEKLAYVFNPVQLLFPLPLPVEALQKTPSAQNYARALLNLIFATIALALFLGLNQLGLPRQGIAAPVLGYFYHFLYLFYLITFSIGILQWCGFVLPQPCDFALLSASPHMRWRRWNRYTYKWLSLTLFFPVLKRTGSRLLALSLCFAVVAAMHLNAILFMPGSPFKGNALPEFLFRHFAYYLGHGVVIWLGFLMPRAWTDENRHSAWLGVALTWLMVTCIFSFYY